MYLICNIDEISIILKNQMLFIIKIERNIFQCKNCNTFNVKIISFDFMSFKLKITSFSNHLHHSTYNFLFIFFPNG